MANLVKQLNAARERVAAARTGVARAAVAAGLAVAGSASHAAGFDDILDAISIGSFDTKIIAVGLVVVGIYLTMQGITVAKRVISKI